MVGRKVASPAESCESCTMPEESGLGRADSANNWELAKSVCCVCDCADCDCDCDEADSE